MVDKLGKQLTLYFLIGTKYINETNLTSLSRTPTKNVTLNDKGLWQCSTFGGSKRLLWGYLTEI